VKTVSEAGLEAIQLAMPNVRVEFRDGIECVVIPTYDFDTDQSGEKVMQLVRDVPKETGRIQIGDVLRHTKTGSPFNIVDPLRAFLKLRKGPKAGD
jgi:hypothetical protein